MLKSSFLYGKRTGVYRNITKHNQTKSSNWFVSQSELRE